MRILYVCHRFPYPPQRGGTIRPFNMIKHLAQSHEVTVCSLTRSDRDTREAQSSLIDIANDLARQEIIRLPSQEDEFLE